MPLKKALTTWWKSKGTSFSGDLKWDEPLSKYTYYQIGGPALLLATPRSEADVELLASCLHETGTRFFILGAGSNILVSDQGFDGIVIRVTKLNDQIRRLDPEKPFIEVGAGAMVSTFLRRATHDGWGGIEFLGGIPGSIGGAVKMNAGTHLGESQSRIRKVTAAFLTSPLVWQQFEGDDLKFEYRKNLFLTDDSLVWSSIWEITPDEPRAVKARIDEVLDRRKKTQPTDYPSCGSVFKNPKEAGFHAWQVLDKLGLRGLQIGNAQISEKHSNFIINLGGATARDVQNLIKLAKGRAQSELGIYLHEEVIYVGEI